MSMSSLGANWKLFFLLTFAILNTVLNVPLKVLGSHTITKKYQMKMQEEWML